jgi:fatty-acid desaturase
MQNHVSATLLWLLFINFFGNCFFVTCIYWLRDIKSEFNIRLELLLTFLVWFGTTQLALGLFLHQPGGHPTYDWVHLVFVARSILASIMTCARPLWLSVSRRHRDFILLPPALESLETLDMVLQIPIATEYFYEFLERQQQLETS